MNYSIAKVTCRTCLHGKKASGAWYHCSYFAHRVRPSQSCANYTPAQTSLDQTPPSVSNGNSRKGLVQNM